MITFYVIVDDPQSNLDKAVGLGGTQVLSPIGIEANDTKFAIAGFIDPERNYIALFKLAQ